MVKHPHAPHFHSRPNTGGLLAGRSNVPARERPRYVHVQWGRVGPDTSNPCQPYGEWWVGGSLTGDDNVWEESEFQTRVTE